MSDHHGKSEIHLIIIWNRGLEKQKEIIEDARTDLDILLETSITWPEDIFRQKLVAFYNNEAVRQYLEGKIERIGVGPFTLLIVEDPNYCYEQRETTHGPDLVNINLFDRKQKYRDWIGHNALHASDNQVEALRDIQQLREDILDSTGKRSEVESLLDVLSKRIHK